jgi:hypothetical protein
MTQYDVLKELALLKQKHLHVFDLIEAIARRNGVSETQVADILAKIVSKHTGVRVVTWSEAESRKTVVEERLEELAEVASLSEDEMYELDQLERELEMLPNHPSSAHEQWVLLLPEDLHRRLLTGE